MAHLRKLVVALLASVAAGSASANVTYTLTELGGWGCNSPTACTNYLYQPLPTTNLVMNLSFSDSGALTGWSYSGAFVNISSAVVPPGMMNVAIVDFHTDSYGQPTNWHIELYSGTPGLNGMHAYATPGSSYYRGDFGEYTASSSAPFIPPMALELVNNAIGFSAGTWSSTGSLQNLNITQHTVAAVPEPETYGMMMAGLGIVGLAARRRKQSA